MNGCWRQPKIRLLLGNVAVADRQSIEVDLVEIKLESTTTAVAVNEIRPSYHARERRLEPSKRRAIQKYDASSELEMCTL